MNNEPTHAIDRHIIKVLTHAKSARYRDLRPVNTDSNLFNYHRKMMIKDGYIRRNSEGSYELSENGLRFAESASTEVTKTRARPKLQITFLLLNKQGEIAVCNKVAQPFIGAVNLPNGKIRFEDENTLESARRLLAKFYADDSVSLQFRGVAEVAAHRSETLLSHTLHMVVVGVVNPKHITNELIEWVNPNLLLKRETTPGTVEMVRDYLGAEYFQYTSYRITV